MVKSSVLRDELFIVLIPQGEVMELAQKIQMDISNYYNIYKKGYYPEIHLTLDRINKEDVEKTVTVIKKMLNNFTTPIELVIDEFSCYHLSSDRFLVIKVSETKSLVKFSNKLHSQLAKKGISTIDNYINWDFHITLISNIFAENPISEQDFKNLCFIFDGIEGSCVSFAESLEVWRPTLNPQKKCIKSFGL